MMKKINDYIEKVVRFNLQYSNTVYVNLTSEEVSEYLGDKSKDLHFSLQLYKVNTLKVDAVVIQMKKDITDIRYEITNIIDGGMKVDNVYATRKTNQKMFYEKGQRKNFYNKMELLKNDLLENNVNIKVKIKKIY